MWLSLNLIQKTKILIIRQEVIFFGAFVNDHTAEEWTGNEGERERGIKPVAVEARTQPLYVGHPVYCLCARGTAGRDLDSVKMWFCADSRQHTHTWGGHRKNASLTCDCGRVRSHDSHPLQTHRTVPSMTTPDELCSFNWEMSVTEFSCFICRHHGNYLLTEKLWNDQLTSVMCTEACVCNTVEHVMNTPLTMCYSWLG